MHDCFSKHFCVKNDFSFLQKNENNKFDCHLVIAMFHFMQIHINHFSFKRFPVPNIVNF